MLLACCPLSCFDEMHTHNRNKCTACFVAIKTQAFLVYEFAPSMSQTALAAVVAVLSGFIAHRQRALNERPVPEENLDTDSSWIEPSCGPCISAAWDCPPCPACVYLGQAEIRGLVAALVLCFVLGICCGSCFCEKLCGFPRPVERHGRTTIRRATTGHAAAG